ncbi:6-phosphogluconolactonase [Mesorhizobium sp. CAU 1741]|uniref:6-phosphogluconolactonase n=1 Tax=Mesorhizobium sp. CAU 1741 TaxID=3140366 RepID=UPI00325B3D50
MNRLPHEPHDFALPDALAAALADKVAGLLTEAINQRGAGFLAVSGGSTPARFFEALSGKQLDWAKIVVTLVDERFVPESSERSNAALVKAKLLVGQAASARFAPLYNDAKTVEAAAAKAGESLRDCPWPLDVAILGMGTDGHTASFFPDADNLADLLDPASDRVVLPVRAKSAGEPRLTLSLARLVEARFLALHIEGEQKRAIVEEALSPGSILPISAVFTHSTKPVPVYWAG